MVINARRLSVWAIVVAALLMIPLLANAPWTRGDFVFGAIALFGAATVYELVTPHMSDKRHRIAVGVAVLVAIALGIAWGASGP